MAIKPVEILINAKDKATPVIKDVGAAMGDIAPAAQSAGAASDAALDGTYRRGLKAADGIKSISEQLAFVQKALVTLQGGSFLATLIKDTAQTADEYNNLASRIKLATGEGELFDQAFERVTQIALDTNSALESTGTLFARLTTAGKDAGLSAQDAVSQALALTESINQAVQLSGASAQASDAALTQLIQGLQGGALRGEEFNSVMEQSPRLARALADGLGVTTGALRTMAQEGRLTTEVVVQALQSQASTLKTEFETLPPTVGRAVQNLATSWTVYVGEADKATGASKLAAQAIDALAKNLDTVAGYLIDAGQAAAAFAAVRLAQTFLGIGAAATTSATAIAANTAAMTAANAASTGAAAGVGRLAALLGGLKTFTLLGLVTNLQDIGTFIGEGIAKLQGYKDKTEELAAAERSRAAAAEEGRKIAAAQLAENKAAIDAQFQLSAAAKSTIAAFDDQVKAGQSAASAVAAIGKDFDLATLPGIANAAAVLDKLAADGKLSATEFQQAWATALKGEDLQAFEARARAALAGTARESERVAAVMDATLREAIRRSGADFDVLAGGMSAASRSAINDVDTIINGMDRLKEQGVDTGKALEASLSKAVKTADSQTAIDALRSRVESLRKALGDKVADGLLRQIEEQATKATGALGGLDGALKKLGITSDAELKKAAADARSLYEEVVRTGGSAREQAAAFEKMANAAIASGDKSAIAFVKSRQYMHGLRIEADDTGKAIVVSADKAARATSGIGDAARRAAGKYRDAGEDIVKTAEEIAMATARAYNQGTVSQEQIDQANKQNAENAKRYGRPGQYSTQKGNEDNYDPGRNMYGRAGQNDQPRNGNGQTQAEFQRAQRLAGQGASDETLRFALAQKLQAGALTADDLGDLRAVVQTLKNNEEIFKNITPGGNSLEALADDAKWRAIRVRMEQEIAKFSGGNGGQAVGRTVKVDINTGAGRETVNTDEAGAQAVVRALGVAARRAGR